MQTEGKTVRSVLLTVAKHTPTSTSCNHAYPTRVLWKYRLLLFGILAGAVGVGDPSENASRQVAGATPR
jgi:hypothetical protein